MLYSDWSLVIVQPFLQELVQVAARLLVAIVVFVIGYLIAVGIGKVVAEILKTLRFNRLFEKEGWTGAFQRAHIEVHPAEFVGAIFKWVFVIVFLKLAVEILQLNQFSDTLGSVLGYLPNVIVAALIFVVAVIISDITEKLVHVGVARMKIGHAYLAGSIVKWAIWIFTLFLVLEQLLPNSQMIQTLYTAITYGIVGAIALGAAIAIGLGGKKAAEERIDDLMQKWQHKH